jgi:hypothetical protein
MIEKDISVVTHKAVVSLPKDEFARINRLLSIHSLEGLSAKELEEIGAAKNAGEGIFCAKFDNGSVLNFDLCSGSNNYWDDVVWKSADETTDITFDCEYELTESIEFEVNGELYVVTIALE